MPGRIRRKRWLQVIAFLLALLVFLVGWWLEDGYLEPPGWQRPQDRLESDQ